MNPQRDMHRLMAETAIWTGLVRNLDAEGETVIRGTSSFWKTHDQSAATMLVAAFDPALNGKCELCVNRIQLMMRARVPESATP